MLANDMHKTTVCIAAGAVRQCPIWKNGIIYMLLLLLSLHPQKHHTRPYGKIFEKPPGDSGLSLHSYKVYTHLFLILQQVR